ncbi:MAG: bifunctional glutamate N-acetyltransferase/amino-acid acetyltransferase ArgJ [Chloroflexi bacterium]|nr:bifunctional glutamate N-acetyltransferase/amino-acid acetyltransferase ArgJ [Chloroflexota bacterium]
MPFDKTVQLAGARARQLQALPRYREVLRLLDEGMSPREIGQALDPPVTRQRASALTQQAKRAKALGLLEDANEDESMSSEMTIVDAGGVTSAEGFSAGSIFAGIKTAGKGKRDIGLLFSDRPCSVAGTFSQNSVLSPSVTLSKEIVDGGQTVRGVVANSGVANCAVGAQGLIDAREATALAAARLGVGAHEVLIASTGVIGVELPMALMRDHIPQIELADDAGAEFSAAILTTDTHRKEIAVRISVGGAAVTIGGCAKGSGMIHPNMATMLAFLTTDAAVEKPFLQKTLSEAVTLSFNQIDIDGDQSTNDTVLLLANGAAGNTPLTGADDDAEAFASAVRYVTRWLAREMARDGEGAQTLIEVTVEGAHSDDDARVAARSVAASLLVRTAVYGKDPNWGRILMAVGKSQIPLDESRIQVFVNDIQIVEDGKAISYSIPSVIAALGEPEVRLRVGLNVGDGFGEAWGCDLTEEYVIFNSAYTT